MWRIPLAIDKIDLICYNRSGENEKNFFPIAPSKLNDRCKGKRR
jgi:hypothetical protein